MLSFLYILPSSVHHNSDSFDYSILYIFSLFLTQSVQCDFHPSQNLFSCCSVLLYRSIFRSIFTFICHPYVPEHSTLCSFHFHLFSLHLIVLYSHCHTYTSSVRSQCNISSFKQLHTNIMSLYPVINNNLSIQFTLF